MSAVLKCIGIERMEDQSNLVFHLRDTNKNPYVLTMTNLILSKRTNLINGIIPQKFVCVMKTEENGREVFGLVERTDSPYKSPQKIKLNDKVIITALENDLIKIENLVLVHKNGKTFLRLIDKQNKN